MNEQEIKQTLTTVLQMSEKESMAAKKSTRPGTWHIGKITGNRLNKSLLRSQFIVCESKADWDNSESDACKALHSDQRVFVQVDDDVWDVYAGAPLNSESSEPVIIAQNKIGLNDLLTETKAELLHSTNSTVSSGGAGEGVQENILAAIRTKPFILLAGISGTGKSRMVRQLARGCCPEYKDEAKTQKHPLYNEQKPGNFEMIPVRPNWHDSTELMGYVTRISSDNKPKYVLTPFVHFLVKAWLHPAVPFFLCLDEMNLAPVEQYFAEYLSAIESRKKDSSGKINTDVLVRFDVAQIDDDTNKFVKATVDALLKDYKPAAGSPVDAIVTDLERKMIEDKGLRIPPNLVVMGTVNMDETTCTFSRKVLDRAMSFELNDVSDMYAPDKLVGEGDYEFESIDADAAKGTLLTGKEAYDSVGGQGVAVASDNTKVGDAILAFLENLNEKEVPAKKADGSDGEGNMSLLAKTPFKIAYRSRNEIMIYCIERIAGNIVPLPQALDEALSMKVLSRIEGDSQHVRPEWLQTLSAAIIDGLSKLDGYDADKCVVCKDKLADMVEQAQYGYTSFWMR